MKKGPPPKLVRQEVVRIRVATDQIQRHVGSSRDLEREGLQHYGQCSLIVPHVYLGSCFNARHEETVRTLQIKTIICVAHEERSFDDVKKKKKEEEKKEEEKTKDDDDDDVEVVRVNIPEDEKDEEKVFFLWIHHIFPILDRSVENKENVMIHCAHGRSRSAACIVAWLMSPSKDDVKKRSDCGDMTLKQALDHVKSRRPQVDPNEDIMRYLIAWEKKKKKSQQEEGGGGEKKGCSLVD